MSSYDLDRINAERLRRKQRPLSSHEAQRAVSHAPNNCDLSNWLIMHTIMSASSHNHRTHHETPAETAPFWTAPEPSTSSSSSYDSGGYSGGGGDSGGGGGGGGE